MLDDVAGVRTAGYRRVLIAASIGTFIELYDIWVFGYFATFLAGQFFPRDEPTAALLATFGVFARSAGSSSGISVTVPGGGWRWPCRCCP